MKVATLFYGEPNCRCYCIGEEGEECILVDFGASSGKMILDYIARHHRKCAGLLLTHGHFDHISGLEGFEDKIDFPIYIASEDECCLEDPFLNGSRSFGLPPVSLDVDKLPIHNFDDGEEIDLGIAKVKAIKTPFHTFGSSVFLIGDALFSGDTLFHLSIGRSDLPHACPRLMSKSLAKIKSIAGNPKVYPGHGPSSFLEEEKANNPFLH